MRGPFCGSSPRRAELLELLREKKPNSLRDFQTLLRRTGNADTVSPRRHSTSPHFDGSSYIALLESRTSRDIE